MEGLGMKGKSEGMTFAFQMPPESRQKVSNQRTERTTDTSHERTADSIHRIDRAQPKDSHPQTDQRHDKNNFTVVAKDPQNNIRKTLPKSHTFTYHIDRTKELPEDILPNSFPPSNLDMPA